MPTASYSRAIPNLCHFTAGPAAAVDGAGSPLASGATLPSASRHTTPTRAEAATPRHAATATDCTINTLLGGGAGLTGMTATQRTVLLCRQHWTDFYKIDGQAGKERREALQHAQHVLNTANTAEKVIGLFVWGLVERETDRYGSQRRRRERHRTTISVPRPGPISTSRTFAGDPMLCHIDTHLRQSRPIAPTTK